MDETLKKRSVPLQDVTSESDAEERRAISSSKHSDQEQSVCCQFMMKRYVVAVMAFLGFFNVYALRVNLSIAVVAMLSNRTEVVNGTVVQIEPEFSWDSRLVGLILGSFFYGYIFTQIPGGILASKFGGRNLFGGGIFVTAVLTLLTPLCVRGSVYLFIVVRILEGIFEGVTYPSIHAIWAKWAPPLERSKLATIAFSGSYMGTVVSMPLSGLMAAYLGWPSLFYFFGALAILWCILWFLLISDSPSEHPTISQEELEYIQYSMGYTDKQTQNLHPPWLKMATSVPVWAIICAHFAENWGFYTLLTSLPTFLHDVFSYRVAKTGFVAALPYLVMGIVVQVGGHIADFLRRSKKLTTTNVRKLFTCGAYVFQTVFMITAAYLMTPAAAITAITIAVGFGGLTWAGFSVNHLDIAPQYASILMGVSNTFATLPGIISPGLTGAIVQHKLASEWRIVFYISAAIYLLGAVVFGLCASGERQDWAQMPMGYMPHLDPDEETEAEEEQ
ncbi:vesicular glutamate transporter 3 [Lingula anatina]|uniref:Sialin n=1 Tax=Lingula anatina TaxID=7574 RepID=A0A1S3I207_LINAN|nr:vesicular glutamate transporter 3 [Lingula anatina]|eukprot:XP_013392278.1 vesicular glutamate transporter 3 [Lingula anatina]